MASPERNISAVPTADARRPVAVAERLASLEDEAARLRAEVAALHDEIRWLTGLDADEPGWLERGWVRASLLLTGVGLVALVSLPYLLHADASGPHADVAPAASARPAPAGPRVPASPAAVEHTARKPVPGPTRVRTPEVPAPARLVSVEDRPAPAPRPRPAREPRAEEPSDPVVVAPTRGESP
jgi:hypothetical protein